MSNNLVETQTAVLPSYVWAVVNTNTGTVRGTYSTRSAARIAVQGSQRVIKMVTFQFLIIQVVSVIQVIIMIM